MTRILLVRHATTADVGRRVSGRAAGVALTEAGRREAAALAGRLGRMPIAALWCSPRERVRDTAAPLAARLGLEAVVDPRLDELEFGEWTGLGFEELDRDARWRWFNAARATVRIPGGELFTEVQARALAACEDLGRAHPDATVAAVTHGDVIRGVLAHCFGTSADLLDRFEVEPASVSVVALAPWGARVLAVNDRAHLE